jgi:hypothetical protein
MVSKKFELVLVFSVLLIFINASGILACTLLGQVYNSTNDLVDGAFVEVRCMDGTYVGTSAATSAGYWNWGNAAGDCNLVCNNPNQFNISTTFMGEYAEKFYGSDGPFIQGMDIYTEIIPPPQITITSIGGDNTPSINPNFSTSDTTPLILVSTDKAIACRWSTTDVSFSVMSEICGVVSGTNFQCPVLTNTGEGVFDFFVSCSDVGGRENTAEDNDQANVEVDITRPIKTPVSPISGTTFISSPVDIQVNLSEGGSCRWIAGVGSDTSYGGMSNACTLSSDGLNHTCPIILSEGSNEVHIACADDTDSVPNADDATQNYDLIYILDSTPITSINIIKISDDNTPSINPNFSVSDTTPNLTVTTNDAGNCYAINDSDLGYDSILVAGGVVCDSDATFQTHYCYFPTKILKDGFVDFYVACQDTAGNKNTPLNNGEADAEVDNLPPFPSNPNPLNESTITTDGVNITVDLDDLGQCRASFADESFDDMGDNFDCSGDNTLRASCNVTGFIHGINKVYIACKDYIEAFPNDYTGFANYELTYNVVLDTIPPVITIVYPNNYLNTSFYRLDVNYTVTDNLEIGSCWYSNDSMTKNYTLPNCNNLTALYWDGIWVDGQHTVKIWANDSAGNEAFDTIIFTIDTKTPTITNILIDPILPFTKNNSEEDISINFDSSEYPIDLLFNLYDNTGTLVDTQGPQVINDPSDLPIDYNIPGGLADGIYTLNMTLTDFAGNEGITQLGIFTIDGTVPEVLINFPVEGQTYSGPAIEFNFSLSEQGLCQYTLNNGGGETNRILMVEEAGNKFYSKNSSISDGSYTVTAYCEDDYENKNHTESVDFIIFTDTVPPVIDIKFPDNYINSSNGVLNINYTVSDDKVLGSCWYANDTMVINYSINNCVNLTYIRFSEGEHTVTIWANDSSGNEAFDIVTFNIDTISPSSTNLDHYPSFDYFNDGDTQMNSIRFDPSEYPINIVLKTYDNTGTLVDTQGPYYVDDSSDFWLDYPIPGGLAGGSYVTNMTLTDPAGNSNTTELSTFIVDIRPPVINIINPVNYANSSDQWQNVNYTYEDVNFGYCWYSNDTMTRNYSLLDCNNLTNLYWYGGQHTVTIWANDSSGNEAFDTVTFNIDAVPPTITNLVMDPILPFTKNNSEENISIDFDPSEYPINLVFNLYDDAGLLINTQGPYYIDDLSDLPIDYTILGGFADGTYTLNMTLTDSAGNDGITQLGNFTIDGTVPEVLINFPVEGQTYQGPIIEFNFSLSEQGLCQYTLNNGGGETNRILMAEEAGNKFYSKNSSISDGSYTVTAYCEDDYENKNHTESVSFVIFSSISSPDFITIFVNGSNLGNAKLNWGQIADAEGYKIWYDTNVTKILQMDQYKSVSAAPTANVTLLSSTNTSWNDTDASNHQQRYYAVAAYNYDVMNVTHDKVGKYDIQINDKGGSIGHTLISFPLEQTMNLADVLPSPEGYDGFPATVKMINENAVDQFSTYNYIPSIDLWIPFAPIGVLEFGKGYYLDYFGLENGNSQFITNYGRVPTGNITQYINEKGGSVGHTMLGWTSLGSEEISSLLSAPNGYSGFPATVKTINEGEIDQFSTYNYISGIGLWIPFSPVGTFEPANGYYLDYFGLENGGMQNITYERNPH